MSVMDLGEKSKNCPKISIACECVTNYHIIRTKVCCLCVCVCVCVCVSVCVCVCVCVCACAYKIIAISTLIKCPEISCLLLVYSVLFVFVTTEIVNKYDVASG